MKKILSFIALYLLILGHSYCQQLSATLGTPSYFIEGLTGVDNIFYISEQEVPLETESADFYITDKYRKAKKPLKQVFQGL